MNWRVTQTISMQNYHSFTCGLCKIKTVLPLRKMVGRLQAYDCPRRADGSSPTTVNNFFDSPTSAAISDQYWLTTLNLKRIFTCATRKEERYEMIEVFYLL